MGNSALLNVTVEVCGPDQAAEEEEAKRLKEEEAQRAAGGDSPRSRYAYVLGDWFVVLCSVFSSAAFGTRARSVRLILATSTCSMRESFRGSSLFELAASLQVREHSSAAEICGPRVAISPAMLQSFNELAASLQPDGNGVRSRRTRNWTVNSLSKSLLLTP